MLRIAFSTVACPDWTLDRVAEFGARCGFQGIELRSHGYGGGMFASDPGLSDGSRVRQVLLDAGIDLAGVASGITLDRPVQPPVLGHLLGIDNRVVDEAKQFVDIAAECGAGYTRVFGFRSAPRERHRSAARRIADRLARLCDHADKRDLKVVLENGGDFATAADLLEIADRVDSPLLRLAYDPTTARRAEEDPVSGAMSIIQSLEVLRLRDVLGDQSVPLGEGEEPLREVVEAVSRTPADVWALINWDCVWIEDLAPGEEVLPAGARLLSTWSAPRAHAAA